MRCSCGNNLRGPDGNLAATLSLASKQIEAERLKQEKDKAGER